MSDESSDTDDTLSTNTSDEESEGESDLSDDGIGGFYGDEPEYSKEEFKKILSEAKQKQESSSSSSDRSDDDLDSSRLENLHWCKCRKCVIGMDFALEECLCCQECGILAEKLQGIKCITEHKGFNDYILSPYALEITLIVKRRQKKIFKKLKKITNRQYRYAAYHQYSYWTHYYEILGRHKRVVIPSCAVKKIKDTFPEPIGGHYTGFKRALADNVIDHE
ncbi:uncharacterized protein [Clytia hemisphaerica]